MCLKKVYQILLIISRILRYHYEFFPFCPTWLQNIIFIIYVTLLLYNINNLIFSLYCLPILPLVVVPKPICSKFTDLVMVLSKTCLCLIYALGHFGFTEAFFVSEAKPQYNNIQYSIIMRGDFPSSQQPHHISHYMLVISSALMSNFGYLSETMEIQFFSRQVHCIFPIHSFKQIKRVQYHK